MRYASLLVCYTTLACSARSFASCAIIQPRTTLAKRLNYLIASQIIRAMKESVPPAVAAKTSATGSGGAASRGGLLAQVRAAGAPRRYERPQQRQRVRERTPPPSRHAEARAAAGAAARAEAEPRPRGRRKRAPPPRYKRQKTRRARPSRWPSRAAAAVREPDAAAGPRGRASGAKREGLLRRALEARERRRPGPEAPERM